MNPHPPQSTNRQTDTRTILSDDPCRQWLPPVFLFLPQVTALSFALFPYIICVYQTPLSASSNLSGIHLKYLKKLDPIMAHWPELRQNYTYMASSRVNGSDIYVRASSAAMDHSQGVAVRWGHYGDPDRKRGSAVEAMVHTTSLAFDLGPRRDLAH